MSGVARAASQVIRSARRLGRAQQSTTQARGKLAAGPEEQREIGRVRLPRRGKHRNNHGQIGEPNEDRAIRAARCDANVPASSAQKPMAGQPQPSKSTHRRGVPRSREQSEDCGLPDPQGERGQGEAKTGFAGVMEHENTRRRGCQVLGKVANDAAHLSVGFQPYCPSSGTKRQ